MLKLYHQEVPRKPDGQTLDSLKRPSIYVDDIQAPDGTKHNKTKTVLLFANTTVGVEVNKKKTQCSSLVTKMQNGHNKNSAINLLKLRQISNAEDNRNSKLH